MSKALVWLRRDLRLSDHTALARATQEHDSVAVCFVFDTVILEQLGNPNDRRLTFIYQSLMELKAELVKQGSDLILLQGDPTIEIPLLAKNLEVNAVYCNHDYEPYAKSRDSKVSKKLFDNKIEFKSFRDQVVFESKEILSGAGTPFKVFTPYKNAWLKELSKKRDRLLEQKVSMSKFAQASELKSVIQNITLESLGFKPQDLWIQAGENSARKLLTKFEPEMSNYAEARNFPALNNGTSHLSVHLRFGTISIRECMRASQLIKGTGSETWMSELIWREFYQMVLDQFPHVAEHKCFKPEYDRIQWPGTNDHFEAWCEGMTGFPIVDAAIREFNATGWMHNRLRMIVASFLTKDLLVDWRKGEAYFAQHLLDYDLASNSGGWQWSASVGCDAQPYFRIFNPESQAEKFDPDQKYIKKWIPELGSKKYPSPIVEHDVQRKLAIELFKR
ncbi:MAG: deoxyribodipyrimidine photo-lyase [Xanthomonadaceae bacterium]|nr:deoxyribodipyrimidine photo-lyase [Xanthomonadaceae bacterium]